MTKLIFGTTNLLTIFIFVYICGTDDVRVVNKITDDVIDRYGNRDLSADDDK